MRTNRMWCRNRKGMSTVLGTLIFIGILFSAVVPMFLVMQQADIILDQEKLEIRRVDDERSREIMDFYAYPVNDKLELKVNSRFELPIRIVHLWINNTLTDVDFEIPPMKQDMVLGQYDVPVKVGVNREFKVKVTTDRGNVYESRTGDIIYDAIIGWTEPERKIIVFIGAQGSGWWNQWANYKAILNKVDPYFLYPEQTKSWTFGTCMFQFDVDASCTYHLKVQKKSFWGGSWTTIQEMVVTITWPSGSPVVEVYI